MIDMQSISSLVANQFPKAIDGLFGDTQKERGNQIFVTAAPCKETQAVKVVCNDFVGQKLKGFYTTNIANELQALIGKMTADKANMMLLSHAQNAIGFDVEELSRSLPATVYDLLLKAEETKGPFAIVGAFRNGGTQLLFCSVDEQGVLKKEFYRTSLKEFLDGLIKALLGGKENFEENIKKVLPL